MLSTGLHLTSESTLRSCFALSNLHFGQDLQPWDEKQDRNRPSFYEARNQTLGDTLHDPSATMPIMWNNN